MNERFSVGDVVQLKSGGQTMTVEEVTGDDISCVWFEGKNTQRQTFASGTLKVYAPPRTNLRVTRA